MKKGLKIFFIIILIIFTIFIYISLFLLYGFNNKFRDWLIYTSMTTMNHKNIAKLFYDEETIKDCMNRNYISEFSFNTNLEEIEVIDYSKLEDIKYKDEFEEEILNKSKDNNDYKIIQISGEKYNGYLAIIYDPSRVEIAVTKYLGEAGQYLTSFSEQNNAYISLTGGGFVDLGEHGTGGEPLGITIKDGELIHETIYNKDILKGGLIGITNEHKLFLGDITSSQALKMGIKYSVSFGPFLIVNGESADIAGIAGGLSPRTAIGQRKDGIFLFLVLDGDRTLRKRCFLSRYIRYYGKIWCI